MDANNIKETWFKNINSVGISAGASTPDKIIQRVIQKVKTISNVNKKEDIYG